MLNNIDTLAQVSENIMSDRFRSTVSTIDEQFGEGYAESNPDLIGKMLQAGAIDYAARIFEHRSERSNFNEGFVFRGLSDSCRLEIYETWKKIYRRENPNADPDEYNQAMRSTVNALGI